MAIGIVGEAQTAAAVLGHNFPDSKWYKDAYNLVKSGGLEPSENKGSYISRAFKKIGSRGGNFFFDSTEEFTSHAGASVDP